jgi:hypothetical protein
MQHLLTGQLRGYPDTGNLREHRERFLLELQVEPREMCNDDMRRLEHH